MKFNFSLISLAKLDYHIFLKSIQPEEVVLGVLADFKGDSPEGALKQIIQRIEETTSGDFSLKRYFNQLRVLAQLRNLELNLKNAMDSIAQHINEERDVLYLRGLDKANEQQQAKFVTNLLREGDFSLERIAKIADVSVEYVTNIQRKLSSNK